MTSSGEPHIDAASGASKPAEGEAAAGVRVRLYVARQTPNSIRAEENLTAALKELGDAAKTIELEIVDVFRQPRRAINDGIIATPTVIVLGSNGRRIMILGDLATGDRLQVLLKGLQDVSL